MIPINYTIASILCSFQGIFVIKITTTFAIFPFSFVNCQLYHNIFESLLTGTLEIHKIEFMLLHLLQQALIKANGPLGKVSTL